MRKPSGLGISAKKGSSKTSAAPDDDSANANLGQLVSEIQRVATRPLWREATWIFCDRCGCSVDTELIHPETHHYSDDGDFFCQDCWEAGID